MSNQNSGSSSNSSWFWIIWILWAAGFSAWIIYDFLPASLDETKAVVALAGDNPDAVAKIKSFLAEDASPSHHAIRHLKEEVNTIVVHEFAIKVAGESAVKHSGVVTQDRAIEEAPALLSNVPEWVKFLVIMLFVAGFGIWFMNRDSD